MRPGTGSIALALLVVLAVTPTYATLPRIAVISIDADEFSPDESMISSVSEELAASGRFDVVDLGEGAFVDTAPDSLLSTMVNLAGANALDLFLALEVLPQESQDRTMLQGDSLKTVRTVDVTVLGRFYSSTGTLLGTISNVITREGQLPFVHDRFQMARDCAVTLAERSLLELFPLEVSFTYDGGRLFEIPMGTDQGIGNGTVMSAVAASSGIPTDPSEYEALRSRGLLQVTDAGRNRSTARLLSGRLVPGGTVTAIERSAPAMLSGGYSASSLTGETGEGMEDDVPAMSSGIRLAVFTARWGLSFGGGFSASMIDHASHLGVDLSAGTRIPVGSPALGLRLSGGGGIQFLMQDVRSDSLVSNATAVTVNGTVDATLEYLFSDHLGLELGCTGVLGTKADSWTVQSLTGEIRNARPDELYYTRLGLGPVALHAGIFYMMF